MIERLKDIFKGLESAHGITRKTEEIRHDGKNEVRSKTIREPVTNELWEKHLKGEEPGLGIIPINEDNKCKWGAIDIDTYPFDHLKLIKKIREKKLPLIVFRSKSGGAHVYCFTKQFVPASLMRQKLQLMASSLGYAKAEIFPKQSKIMADRGDVGSFLNMPYHGGDRTVKYAIDDNGNSLTIDSFIKSYDLIALEDIELENLFVNKTKEKEKEAFPDGPPCLNTIIKNGPIVEGNGDVAASGRDNGLFNIGVYLKKFNPTGWKKDLDNYNDEKYIKPKLSSEDVIRIKEQVEKKDYDYRCKDKPICNFCNEKLCYTKQYGKGGDVRMPSIESIRKYESDPPIFFVDIDEDSIEVDAATLHDHEKFSIACMTELGRPLIPVAKLVWRKQLASLMKNMATLDAPDDAKVDIQLKELLTEFISRDGKDISAVLQSKPYTENGVSYFKFKDFWRFIIRSKSWPEKTYSKNKTIRLVENLFNGKTATKDITVKVKGKEEKKTVKLWTVEKIEVQEYTPKRLEKKAAPFE
jgi:hypothetical protein